MTVSGPIDRQVLSDLAEAAGDDRTFLNDLIDAYLRDASAQLGAMRDAVHAGDAASFNRAAHSLKSTSGSVGAVGLAALCAELEAFGAAGSLDVAAAQMQVVADEFARVREALLATRPAPDEVHG